MLNLSLRKSPKIFFGENTQLEIFEIIYKKTLKPDTLSNSYVFYIFFNIIFRGL